MHHCFDLVDGQLVVLETFKERGGEKGKEKEKRKKGGRRRRGKEKNTNEVSSSSSSSVKLSHLE